MNSFMREAIRQLSKPYLQPYLNPGPRSKDRAPPPPDLAPGLLMLFCNQLCVFDEGAGAVLHSLRDRLRAVECPSDIIDAIGG